MRADRPLIGAVLCLAAGLGLIFGYCQGTTGFSAAYPFSQSQLHVAFTTIGPGVLGGLALIAIGVLLLIWAFLSALVCQIGLLAGRDQRIERIVERYPEPEPETTRFVAPAATGTAGRKHFL
ncbi:MAG: hypothetical protein ACRD19_10060 [Terriglobia bacterium]